jgi:hypothetical protein
MQHHWHCGNARPAMSDSSHSGEGLAEDEQDVVGQPVAGVLEQEPDHPLDRGAQVGQGQRRGYLVVQVEESPGAVPGLDQPVGVEQQPVTGLELDVLPGRARVQASYPCGKI